MSRKISLSTLLAVVLLLVDSFVAPLSLQAGTIWDAGGGGATNIDNNVNWDSDVTPTLTGGTSLLTFGTAGASANINTSIDVLGINVNLNGFTFGAGGGTVTLRGSGMTSSSTANVTLSPAAIFNGSQSIANNGTALLLFNSTSAGLGSPTLTNNGTGTGATQFAGTINNTVLKIVQNSSTSQLNLRGASNSFGNLEIWRGTVGIGNGGSAYGNGAMTLGNPAGGSNNATLLHDNNGNDTYNRAIVLASNTTGTLTIAQNTDLSGTFTATFTGGITGNNSFVIENRGGNESITFSTGLINNVGTITHIGTSGATGTATINSVIGANVTGLTQNAATSVLRLNGANTYGGITIATAGNLQLGNINAVQNSTLDVSGAGTITFNVAGTNTYNHGGLQGAGTLNAGANSLTIGGLSPGNSAGLLTVTTGTLSLGGDSEFELDGNARGTQYDAVDVTGSLVYDGDLVIDINFAAGMFQTFDLFNFTGTQSGAFDNIIFLDDDYAGTFDYATGVLTLTMVPVPEPTSAALLGLGMLGLTTIVRRKNRQHQSVH